MNKILSWIFFMLWLVFPFHSGQTTASNCILRCYSQTTPILNFKPSISLFGFTPQSFPEFVIILVSESQAVYILASPRPLSTSTLANKTLPSLLLFLLAIWHNLMALPASCFPFYHLRCFGYSVINLGFLSYSWFKNLV